MRDPCPCMCTWVPQGTRETPVCLRAPSYSQRSNFARSLLVDTATRGRVSTYVSTRHSLSMSQFPLSGSLERMPTALRFGDGRPTAVSVSR